MSQQTSRGGCEDYDEFFDAASEERDESKGVLSAEICELLREAPSLQGGEGAAAEVRPAVLILDETSLVTARFEAAPVEPKEADEGEPAAKNGLGDGPIVRQRPALEKGRVSFRPSSASDALQQARSLARTAIKAAEANINQTFPPASGWLQHLLLADSMEENRREGVDDSDGLSDWPGQQLSESQSSHSSYLRRPFQPLRDDGGARRGVAIADARGSRAAIDSKDVGLSGTRVAAPDQGSAAGLVGGTEESSGPTAALAAIRESSRATVEEAKSDERENELGGWCVGQHQENCEQMTQDVQQVENQVELIECPNRAEEALAGSAGHLESRASPAIDANLGEVLAYSPDFLTGSNLSRYHKCASEPGQYFVGEAGSESPASGEAPERLAESREPNSQRIEVDTPEAGAGVAEADSGQCPNAAVDLSQYSVSMEKDVAPLGSSADINVHSARAGLLSPTGLVPFRNLDTGEVRYVPMNYLSGQSEILHIFNPESEALEGLQRKLRRRCLRGSGRAGRRRRRSGGSGGPSSGTEGDLDEETGDGDDDDEGVRSESKENMDHSGTDSSSESGENNESPAEGDGAGAGDAHEAEAAKVHAEGVKDGRRNPDAQSNRRTVWKFGKRDAAQQRSAVAGLEGSTTQATGKLNRAAALMKRIGAKKGSGELHTDSTGAAAAVEDASKGGFLTRVRQKVSSMSQTRASAADAAKGTVALRPRGSAEGALGAAPSITDKADTDESTVVSLDHFENIAVGSTTSTKGSAAQAPAGAGSVRRPWFKKSVSSERVPPFRLPTRMSGGKECKEFSNLYLLKELRLPEEMPVWSLSVSEDGRWLAAGVQDGTVRLWRVTVGGDQSCGGPHHLSSISQGGDTIASAVTSVTSSSSSSSPSPSTTLPQNWLFSPQPTKILRGHTATIVAVRWDRWRTRLRIASASLDRTVRVWTIEDGTAESALSQSAPSEPSVPTAVELAVDESADSEVPVCVLHCTDWPTALCFHPSMKAIVFTGSLDGTIQVWKVHVGRKASKPVRAEMLEFIRMTDLITAMTVSPDGLLLAVGLRYGRVGFYDAKSLRFRSELDCKNRKGKHSCGRKVTGLAWSEDSASLCVSTSDSRLRLIAIRDLSRWTKYKGHINNQIMLKAEFSPDEKHLVCGSENSHVYLWDVHPPTDKGSIAISKLAAARKQRRPTISQTESFRAFEELLTACVCPPSTFSRLLCHQGLEILEANRSKTDFTEGGFTGASDKWPILSQEGKLCVWIPPLSVETAEYLGHTAKFVTIVAGSYRGRIRIFANLSDPVRP